MLHCPPSAPEDARLVEGGGPCSGRLEMKHQGLWRALNIMDKSQTKVDYAQVACRQISFGSVVSVTRSTNNTGQQPAWEVSFTCQGTESTLKECRSSTMRRSVWGKTNSTSGMEVICSGNTENKNNKKRWHHHHFHVPCNFFIMFQIKFPYHIFHQVPHKTEKVA